MIVLRPTPRFIVAREVCDEHVVASLAACCVSEGVQFPEKAPFHLAARDARFVGKLVEGLHLEELDRCHEQTDGVEGTKAERDSFCDVATRLPRYLASLHAPAILSFPAKMVWYYKSSALF